MNNNAINPAKQKEDIEYAKQKEIVKHLTERLDHMVVDDTRP